jgi:ABC-2 type transport system ATP-binding protein
VLEGVLRTVSERGRTVLMSSHTLSDVQRMADTIGIIHEGRLLVHCGVDALLRRTKRIRAVLADPSASRHRPEGVIWERVNSREWLLTVRDFSTDVSERLKAANHLEHLEVIDLGLEDIFKDYVRGWRASP